jgi:excinuclease ABC subunit A
MEKISRIKAMKNISIRGARTHNLKNINVDLPRDKLIVITGLSGSGKSSLAFDTLYAEGQRRYVESLSTYARQFLSVMEKPDVDHIEGLSPAISIEQKSTLHNPRSTVGTVTEIYDYLRLLFARVGEPRCPIHAVTLAAQTISQMVDQILALPQEQKIMLIAPIVQNRKGEHLQQLEELRNQGFIRIRVNGTIMELDPLPKLEPNKKHNIEVIIDRIKIKADNQSRLADSLETALNIADGIVKIVLLDQDEQELVFSAKFSCPKCGYSLAELEPRIFSFNNPIGACPDCDGLGVQQFMDPDKIIFDATLSLASGAIRGWDSNNIYYYSMLCSLAKHYKFTIDTPFCKLKKKIQNIILYGSGEEIITFTYQHYNQTTTNKKHAFEGIINNMERRYHDTDSPYIREELAKFLSQQTCPACCGTRLATAARHVFINDTSLPVITNMPIKQAYEFLKKIQLAGWRGEIAKKILKEITARLGFLINVGLEYLTISRNADTLSGGEAQRIRLASQIGAGLVGVMYVLDEPSIGLHQRDNARLLKTLIHLRDLGNTVIVVEHDAEAILNADHVLDIGPGAGIHGGHVVANGTPQQIMQNKDSLTGQYLSGQQRIAIPEHRLPFNPNKIIKLIGAKANNLQDISVEFPVGLFCCITGVSGSGKSTLINDTLYPIAAKCLNGTKQLHIGAHDSITGLEHVDKVVDIAQSPIGRTPRSNTATYTGLFTDIRDLFANTQDAKARGYKVGRFSFNVKGGRCEACQGDGLIRIEMHFLADTYVTCDVCKGKRYNRETLEIYYKGKNIHEVLEMTVAEAFIFFQAIPAIARKLQTLLDVGLGYIKIGQSATTLSGGEAQRIKLSKELSRKDTGNTLYILDEPTTGLHFHDIKRLLKVLITLRDHGNTIIVIEHNLEVIKTADWIIDLGPEGGDGGGQVLVIGTPETISKNPNSYTGKFLKKVLTKTS